ncbi:MAG TPA: ornithine cyclodeaminase family protein [Solirubrobacteraceae bacterium]|nr:ornithine cyclodeaminase family protein [Solirubrobacteraceae bacterium]
MRVLVLSHGDIHASLPPEECEREMASVLAARARGEAYNPLRSIVAPPGARGFMGLMPSYADGPDDAGVFGLKAICLMPGNPARGLDTHQGTVTLFDGETGIPTAILDASAITEIRTAAVTAAATRTLAREGAGVLAILGAGVQARAHLAALASVRAWSEVRVYAPTPEHARAVVAAGAGPTQPPLARVIDVPTAGRAVDGADVVVTATSSRTPVLEHGWLAPGAHVNAVGASSPNSRELSVETVTAAALFCDSRESVRNEAGEFRLAVEQGAIAGDDHIRAELGEVLAGIAAGRRDDDELTVFRSLGIGVEDLAAARLTVANARRRGLGTEVEL